MKYYSEYIEQLQEHFKSLTDQESARWVRIEYEDILQEAGASPSAELASFLSEHFSKELTALQANPQLMSFYQKVWHDMAFKGFIALAPQDQISLLEQRVVSALKNGVNIEVFIQSYIDAYPGVFSEVKTALSGFAHNLAQNTETLGEVPVEIDGKKYFPQVKFWIQDYLAFPTKSAKRGNLERLTYINQSPNARKLTQVQRQQLLEVLKLYDDLVNPPMNVGVATPVSRGEEIPSTNQASVLQRPVSPAPQPSKHAQPMPVPQSAKTLSPIADIPETRPQGLDMGMSIPPSINIDQRLEDLKKRVQK